MAAHSLPVVPVSVTLPHFSRILVPLDFSAPSIVAFERSIDLARVYRASLVLAHIVNYRVDPPPPGVSGEATVIPALDRQHNLESLREMAAARGIPCSIEIRKGPILENVRQLIRQESIDLLVMATQEKHSVHGAILGPMAEDLVRGSAIPVLSISPMCLKSNWDGNGPRHILFAGSFLPETLCGLSLALGWQQATGARLSVVEAVPMGSRRFSVRPLREHIESLVPPGTDIRLLEGPVAYTVCTLARDLDAGLIALGVHRSSLARDLFATALEEILLTAPCPVLTVRQPCP